MTKQELRAMQVDFYTAADIAPIIKIDPRCIRNMARTEPETLGFETICWGKRVRIPKRAFWEWWDKAVGWDEEQPA